MLSLLNYKNNTQYGLDITYKIIPKSFTRYKMMTIYAIDNKTNLPKLAALICLQNYDTESLKKIFGLLTVSFSFSPKFITTDYSYSQIKALKECETFNTKPEIDEILKCKKLYANNNGNNNSYITLKDKLKALNKLFMTNNICESILGLISKN